MKLINADKVIEKLKEHKSLFCKNRDEFRALSDKDKARVDEIDTCIAELVNAEEVPHAQLGTNLAEVGTDCISRQAAIDALNSRKTAEQCEAGKTRNWTVDICVDMIKQLPPIQPEPQYKTNYGFMWLCPKCGLPIHSDYTRCVRCGHNREKGV